VGIVSLASKEKTMGSVLGLVKGWTGKPSHPPLTDATIGAYTVGVAMLVLGALDVEQEEMAHGALLAIGGGLALALPTALTGLLDWLDLRKGTSAKRTATLHLVAMVAATVIFVITFLVHLDGYRDGDVTTAVWILGLAAETVLTLGGWIGGTLVFVYGLRVLKRDDISTSAALVPGRAEGRPPAE
jgi:uncharacterized membrane protein